MLKEGSVAPLFGLNLVEPSNKAPPTGRPPVERSCRPTVERPSLADLNRESAIALERLLPGVGEKLAANIVEHRASFGPFQSAADLAKNVVRGQYFAGDVDGEQRPAYRSEPKVNPKSNVETFVAMKLSIDTWRWSGVPFYLRTGKHMGRRTTEIAIRFKSAPFAPFRGTGMDAFGPDWLVLQIQPDEGISLQFDVKRPGPRVELAPVRMDFKYADWFRAEPNVGYETLLYDCMTGDATLFQRADMVEACWRAVQPILDDWAQRTPADFPNYASGSAGPASADTLLALGGRSWRPLNSAAELNARRTAKPKVEASASAEKKPAARKTAKRAAANKTVRVAASKKAAPARKVAVKKAAVKKAPAKKAVAKKAAAARKAAPVKKAPVAMKKAAVAKRGRKK